MTTSLSNRDAQRLLGALKTIDAGGEIKLTGQTRIAIAININRLTPMVAAFEVGSQRRQLDFLPGAEARDANTAIQRELLALADDKQGYELRSLTTAALDLDANPKITGDQVAALAPILSDFEAQAKAA